MEAPSRPINAFIDVTGEVCPMTFVKIRLRLDILKPGDVLEARLKGAEALANVPLSARALGHTVLSQVPEPKEPADGIHRLLIQVNPPPAR